MPLGKPLRIEPALFAALAVIFIGGVALWSNPRRQINRAFFFVSLHVAAWLACLYLALSTLQGLFWMRTSCVVAGMLPAHLFLLKESIHQAHWTRKRYQICLWVVVGLIMSALPMTGWFIPSHSTAERRIYGWGYFLYMALQAIAYIELGRSTIFEARHLSGAARMELRILLFGGSATAGAILLLMIAGALFHTNVPIHMQPLVVLAFYALTVAAITNHRIFDSEYIFKMILQRGSLVVVIAIAGYYCDRLIRFLIPEPFAFVVMTGIMLTLATRLDTLFDQYFGRYSRVDQVREAIRIAAERHPTFSSLIQRIEEILGEVAKCDGVSIFVFENSVPLTIPAGRSVDCHILTMMRGLRWITPERIQRERISEEGEVLHAFLDNYGFGAAIYRGGGTLELLLGIAIRENLRPYTFPDVQELHGLCAEVEGALARLYLAGKVQRAERLAAIGVLGAGLAHEIRNPLVTIKTFVQLLPTHNSEETFRGRFYDLVGAEVERIERLTEQLLNLATPRRFELRTMSLREAVDESVPLILARAAEKDVRIYKALASAPDSIQIDLAALKQVILNLCINAIQAQESQTAERWIRIESRVVGENMELSVSDNGPGVSSEIRHRMFESFQTTKSSGFGLGLAMSNDILLGMGATLSVDPIKANSGATFRILFPCRRSSN